MPLNEPYMTNEEILEALESGKTYIIEHGWTKGRFRSGKKVCAIGGLLAAQGQELPQSSFIHTTVGLGEALVEMMPVQQALLNAIPNRLYGSLANYNDAYDTTEADILTVYDDAMLATKQKIADEGTH